MLFDVREIAADVNAVKHTVYFSDPKVGKYLDNRSNFYLDKFRETFVDSAKDHERLEAIIPRARN
jgi:hypothetical protein